MPILIIKPRIAGLDTTMVVPTDRRAYYLRLQSKPAEYVARVGFSYPEERDRQWQVFLAKQHEQEEQEKGQRVADLPSRAIEDMYWKYAVKGHAVTSAGSCHGRWCENLHPNAARSYPS